MATRKKTNSTKLVCAILYLLINRVTSNVFVWLFNLGGVILIKTSLILLLITSLTRIIVNNFVNYDNTNKMATSDVLSLIYFYNPR